jgi:enoyl-CoA hydratase/carnithine racemase
MADKVIFEVRDHVAWATLNRPEKLNPIDTDVLARMIEIVAEVSSNDEIRTLALTGAGTAFSAGGDISEWKAQKEGGYEDAFNSELRLWQELSRKMIELEKPTIGAINGYALGGGFEFALICDLRIAARSAKLGLPDIGLGYSPTSGMTYLLPRIIGLGRALQLALLPDPIDASEAFRIGLVTQVVEDGQLLQIVQDIGRRLASFSEQAVMFNKRSFYLASESSFLTVLNLEHEYNLASFRSSLR